MLKKIYLLALLLFLANYLFAANQVITFQGKLTNIGGSRITGSLPVLFSIYSTASGGTALWTETHNSVNFENGVFTVELGSIISFTNLQFDNTYYLGINVNNAGEMQPRTKINYNMFSIKAIYSDTAVVASILHTNAFARGSLTITDTLTVNDSFIIKKDGKVGINTLIPTEQLEVSGNVKANQFIGDGSQLINLGSANLVNSSVLTNHIADGTILNEDISLIANINPIKIDTALIRLADTQLLSGINVLKIGGGEVDNIEFSYLDGLTASIQGQLNILAQDTVGLLSRINELEADSQNTEIRLTELEADSVTRTYVNTQFSNINSQLSTDTNLLSNRVTNLESDSANTENRLLSLESDSQNTELRLINIEDLYLSKTVINDSLNLKANLLNPIFSGLITADSLIINNTGLIVLKSGNVSIGEVSPTAKLVIKGSGSDNTTTAFLIKNAVDANLFYVDNSGNIGIGTITPTVKLEIAGTVKITDAVEALNTGNRVYSVYAP